MYSIRVSDKTSVIIYLLIIEFKTLHERACALTYFFFSFKPTCALRERFLSYFFVVSGSEVPGPLAAGVVCVRLEFGIHICDLYNVRTD